MSHVVVIAVPFTSQVLIPGMAALVRALVDTGLECVEQSRFRTEDGQEHEVDAVVNDAETGAQVGVRFDPRSGETRLLAHENRPGQGRGRALANRIVQHAAAMRTVEELRKKGYQVTRQESRADGAIAIVAQKWR